MVAQVEKARDGTKLQAEVRRVIALAGEAGTPKRLASPAHMENRVAGLRPWHRNKNDG